MHLGDPNDPRLEEVSGVYLRQYHSLVPLDDRTAGQRRQPSLTVPTALYKGTSETDGETYAIRKLLAPPLMEDAISRGRVWVAMGHPNIVRLVEIFTSHDEGQPLSYVVQAFHPNALSLEQAFLHQRMQCNEETIWAVALQLLAALHAAHLAGMAIRLIDLNHVLMTGKDTYRLSASSMPTLAGTGTACACSATRTASCSTGTPSRWQWTTWRTGCGRCCPGCLVAT